MADTSSPPVYSSDSQDNLRSSSPVPNNADLPAYTSRSSPPPRTPGVPQRTPTEHVFELTNKGTAWATLKLKSGARSTNQLPTFVQGEDITGSVNLNLDNWETIHSIVVSVKGQIITAADPSGCYVFLDCVQPIWSKLMGDPRQPQSANDKFNGKLRGLPPQIYTLPQTFLERLTRASIQYDLIVRISRGMLRTHTQMQTSLVYIPFAKPDPPSLLRQLAYQENSPLLGPEADPAGWKSTPFKIRGIFFNIRAVEANCIFSIATPLCYTRGTAIPCVLSIVTPDSQATDLLSSPRTIDVRLRRCVRYRENAGSATNPERGWCEAVEDEAIAVWWLSPSQEDDGIESRHCRLDGEIHLSKSLKPTSAMAHFSVEYTVIIMPFEPAAFISTDTDVLLRERVEIATMYANGPRPKTYSPPSYETSSRSSRSFRANVFQAYTDPPTNS